MAIGLVAAQSLALGIGALGLAGGRSGDYLVASFVLLTKAVVLPVLLYALIRRTPEPRLVVAANGPLVRLAGAGAVALCAGLLMPPLGLGDPHIEHAAVALVLVGIAIVVARRPLLFQLLGLIVAENGLALLAVSVPGRTLVRCRDRRAVRPRDGRDGRGRVRAPHPRRARDRRHRAVGRPA